MIGAGAFWTTLAKRVREQRKIHADCLAAGQFGTMPEAMKTVGQIAALDWVLGQAAEILGDAQHPLPTTQTADEDEY